MSSGRKGKEMRIANCCYPGGTGIELEDLKDAITNGDDLVPGDEGRVFCEVFSPWDPKIARHYCPGGLPVEIEWNGKVPICKEKTCRYNVGAPDLLGKLVGLQTKEP